MKASRLSQKFHKWLGLLVGLQLLIWTVSGFYMVVIDIDIIHGDHLLKSQLENKHINLNLVTSFTEIAKTNPSAHSIALISAMGKPIYQLESPTGIKMVDPENGLPLPPVNEQVAKELAAKYYSGTAAIKTISLIENNPPAEIGSRPLPLWRVDFDDAWGSSFYISPLTGELTTRRHTLWRVFDFAWMLHIMDYDERKNVNNLILRIVSSLALLLVLSGIWHLYFRLNIRARFGRSTS